MSRFQTVDHLEIGPFTVFLQKHLDESSEDHLGFVSSCFSFDITKSEAINLAKTILEVFDEII